MSHQSFQRKILEKVASDPRRFQWNRRCLEGHAGRLAGTQKRHPADLRSRWRAGQLMLRSPPMSATPRFARGPGFHTTHWSVVLLARDTETAQALTALEQLCLAYWQPLYTLA